MDSKQILDIYTKEIIELIELKIANNTTIRSVLNCALTEYAITLIQIQQKAIMGTNKGD